MEEQTYIVALMDGVKFQTTSVDLENIKKLMDDSKIYAIKIGNKGVVKHSIAFIAKSKYFNSLDTTVTLSIANESLYLSSEPAPSMRLIDSIIDDVNANSWILVDDGILFNKSTFQYVEEV